MLWLGFLGDMRCSWLQLRVLKRIHQYGPGTYVRWLSISLLYFLANVWLDSAMIYTCPWGILPLQNEWLEPALWRRNWLCELMLQQQQQHPEEWSAKFNCDTLFRRAGYWLTQSVSINYTVAKIIQYTGLQQNTGRAKRATLRVARPIGHLPLGRRPRWRRRRRPQTSRIFASFPITSGARYCVVQGMVAVTIHKEKTNKKPTKKHATYGDDVTFFSVGVRAGALKSWNMYGIYLVLGVQ